MLDDKAREDFKTNPSSVLAWILMSSYAYYIQDDPILSDGCFDKMCKYALDNYDKLKHRHVERFITKEALRAGTMYHITHDAYPHWCIRMVNQLRKQLTSP